MANKLLDNFSKAINQNLHNIDCFTVHTFYCNNPNFVNTEVKNIKFIKSAHMDYINDAVGFVQICRNDNICVVSSSVTPDHKVQEKIYIVKIKINEQEEDILSSQCEDYVASKGKF